jgi:PTH1 family peptidyl-tRNA hydrolase
MLEKFFIFGLGNPGRDYKDDRHNIGFMVLDQLADQFDISFGKVQFNSLLSDAKYHDQKIFLAKPQTYMNLSGGSVGPLIKYYRIPLERMLIVFDDLDLPLGYLRLRPQGGSGGHKGIQSIINHLGTQEIPRMRLGIGRPPGRMDPSKYVLQSFSDDELPDVKAVLERATSAVITLIDEGIEPAMTRFNSKSEN